MFHFFPVKLFLEQDDNNNNDNNNMQKYTAHFVAKSL